MTTLAILIPTLHSRAKMLERLMEDLGPQVDASNGRVKVYTCVDSGSAEGGETTGKKRQRLMEEAEADYVCQADDDDRVSADYCAEILKAMDEGADVVGFKVRYYEDGVLSGYSVHSNANDSWGQEMRPDGFVLYSRTPNHLNPIRRKFALDVGFRDITYGEDADYANRLRAMHGKNLKEVFVDKFLYDYFFRTNRSKHIVQMYDENGRMTRAGMIKTIREGGSVMVNGMLCTKVEQLP